MQSKRVGDSKCLAAHFTAVRLLTSVDTFMLHLLIRPLKYTLTVLAGKSWFILAAGSLFATVVVNAIVNGVVVSGLTVVNLKMHLVIGHCIEFTITNAARKLILTLMHLFVHSQQILFKAIKKWII